MEQAVRFYKWPEKDVIKSINSHRFQFQVWRNSGWTRYYIDFVFCLGMAILLHALVSNVIDVSTEMYEGEKRIGVLNTMLNMDLYNQVPEQKEMLTNMMLRIWYAIDNVLA